MFDKGIRKSNAGCTHFLPEVRAAACEHYYITYRRLRGVYPTDASCLKRKRGWQGDDVLRDAWTSFDEVHVRNGLLIAQPRSITKDGFKKLVDKYFGGWIATRACQSKGRTKVINLTHAELHELADLLATPIHKDGKKQRFKNIDQALAKPEEAPRICALVDKSRCKDSPDLLHHHLLANVPELHYGPEDRAPELCDGTLKARQQLADVLAGRVPWIVRPARSSDSVPITCFNSTNAAKQAQERAAAAANQRLVNVFWKPEFMDFVFMLDATHFTDQHGPMHARAQNVYISTKHVWGPTEVMRDKSISETTSIMVYCVIHKHLGLVLGPDIMYTGTKFKKSAKPKEQLFREYGIKTWYDISHKRSQCAVLVLYFFPLGM